MNAEITHRLEITRLIRAGRERVFRAWSTAEGLSRWACPVGAEIVEVTVELKVGGRYAIAMRIGDGSVLTAFGTYREICPPSRLVYTWDWDSEEHAMGETLVTVEFREEGDATEVILTHEGFPSGEAKEGHSAGWKSCLDRLGALLDDV